MSTKFESIYKKLNKEQREAVDTVEGPVMVIAGPGTGKTQILTLRIANILKVTDTSPENILALTFTEAASFEMRKRLVDIVGPAGYRVNIFTFHSFSNSIIQSYPDRFPNIIGASNINIIDQIKILQSIIDKTPLKKLKPFGNKYYYLRPVLTVISKLKRDNISEKELKKLIRNEPEKEQEKLDELVEVYQKYQTELRNNFLYDYDDMIMEVIRVLEDDIDLLLELQEKYQYVLADEHQDTNLAQNKLLELLVSYYDEPNLFIVGDDKQAIFRFQGASLDNFNYFKDKFRNTKLITLKKNYRSDQYILDNAWSIISQDKLEGRDVKGKVVVRTYEDAEEEAHDLVKQSETLIESNVSPSEIAILYRDNKDALPIIAAFEKSKIPFVIESDQDLLSDSDIQKLILLLRAVYNIRDREALATAMHIDFLGIDSLEIYKFLKNEESEVADDFKKRVSSWHKTARNTDLVTFFEIIVRESGYLEHVISAEDSVDKMEKLDALFDEVKTLVENHRGYTLFNFLEYIDLIIEHNVLLKKNKKGASTPSVRLMTAHRSKGQEFDHVFISGVNDGHWGNRVRRSGLKPSFLDWPHSNEDERRLFFVALTRARKGIYISHFMFGRDGQSLLPSQFLAELDKKLIEREEIKKSNKARVSQFNKRTKKGPSLKDKEYLSELIKNQALSVTALNNYLSCPWRYFYNNLVRIPTSISKHQMYGIAIHSALKETFDQIKDGKKISESLFLKIFERTLLREPVNEGDYKEMLEKGTKALRGYFVHYKDEWKADSLTELVVKGVTLDDILLTGKLDRVDFVKGGVRVIDYKTGKPKSRNVILGKTKNSDGGIYRQIVFYKILLDRFDNGKYRMEEGLIDFVEPNDRGYYKREFFEVSKEDTKKLEEQIKEVVGEIRNFTFWETRCDDKKCQFCALREMM